MRELEGSILQLVATDSLPVPPYPAVALRVREMVSHEDFGLREVAKVIGVDPALTADLLRAASSAYYSRGEPVKNLSQAITRLGADEVARHALSSGLGGTALSAGPLAPLKRAMWIESLASALACQELARIRLVAQKEEAFVAGLLHDFGKVVATARIEVVLRSNPDFPPQPPEAWAEAVERLHVPVGLVMAARWKLPALVRQVISLHHGETTAGCDSPGLLDVVRTADAVVRLLVEGTHVTMRELEGVPALASRAEREALVALVEKIPPFIAAFEGAATPAQAAAGRWLRAPRTTLAPGERPVDFGVTVTLARRPLEFRAAVMASNGLLLHGPQALPENYVVQALLDCAPQPFRIWAVPRLCRPEPAGFRVELRPFGLGGDLRAAWDELYRRSAPDAPPAR